MVTLTAFFLILGCFVSWFIIHLARGAGVGRSSALVPQHHHTHSGIIPRIGGVGIVVGLAVTYLICFFTLDDDDNQSLIHYSIFAGGVGAFLLGFVDDIHPLGAKVKLLAQVILGLLVHNAGLAVSQISIPFSDSALQLSYFSIVITVVWVVAIMNLINLIDGLDGLAGGVSLMLMSLLAYLAFRESVLFSFILSVGMVGAILGFLFHNFPPAKVYMGDSGAYLIGFIIATVSLHNSQKGTVLAAMIAPVLALALPICDVAFAIIRRGLKGLPIFRPDRGHIHHRLMDYGYSSRKAVLVLYAISFLALVCALLLFVSQGRVLAIVLGIAFALLLFVLRRGNFSPDDIGRMLNDSVQARQDTRNALHLRDWFVTEAERADRGEHLWSDYRFVLRKMGFCRAEFVIGKESRTFFLPNTRHQDIDALWHESRQIGDLGEISLYADKDLFSKRQFIIIADIATEALSKATQRWYVVNGVSFRFEDDAVPATSYRAQKARNVYRPTY